MATSSLKEYLKKYTCNSEEEKKKKKKRRPKPAAKGVVVVDEDPVWQKPVDLEIEEDSTDEEKPQVDEDIEIKHMKRLEQLRMRRPFGAISEDGSGWVSVGDNRIRMSSDDQNSDSSPARKSRAYDNTTLKLERKEFSAVDADLSPPRQHRKIYQLDDQNSDISPPRKRRARNTSLSPKHEQKPSTAADIDLSPPRQRHKRYQSPSSQPQIKVQSSGGRRARYDTPSPERLSEALKLKGDIADLSPPRKQWTGDISPPRKGEKDTFISTDVSARKSSHKFEDDASDFASQVSDLSPPRKRRKGSLHLTEEPMTGLVSGQDIKEEISKKKESDWLRYREMDPTVSGRDAEPVYRNKVTGERMSKDEYLKSQKKVQKKEEKPKEIKLEWGKGLAQKREAEARMQELEVEKDKPFARSRDDPELDKLLKERVRWGDPMAHLVKKKHLEPVLPDLGEGAKMKESGFIIPQEIPSHSWIRRGLDAAPNRYGIKPGRHWDGVDRSNGTEKGLFKRMNDQKATEREAYLWSVSDM
ncbi:BUD13 homolog [Olea europaea var. sylvestris]|uniref:BUD13 homolog n=1 Tax=Olea europaea var. sylvestris TaxID=158386 RepID=UPI000C1D48A2|nr:BUD13 homolog [Olea europaea var. sylvestris]XP_022865943.1 BUD13 homolog [Olea europaea var. sylvestris]